LMSATTFQVPDGGYALSRTLGDAPGPDAKFFCGLDQLPSNSGWVEALQKVTLYYNEKDYLKGFIFQFANEQGPEPVNVGFKLEGSTQEVSLDLDPKDTLDSVTLYQAYADNAYITSGMRLLFGEKKNSVCPMQE